MLQVEKAVAELKKGEVVGLPTETVYGLAASLQSLKGLEKIFALKARPFFDPLIVHVSNLEQARSLVREFPVAAEILAARFWPGPLTFILPKRDLVPDLVTSGLATVAVRWSRHPVAQAVITALGCPVAAPSANKFGRTSPTLKQHVESEFAGEDIYVLEGGAAEVGLESTIVAITGEPSSPELCVLRPGVITALELKSALKPHFKKVQVTSLESSQAPGHLKYHYQPKHPLFVFKNREVLTPSDHQKIAGILKKPKARGVAITLDHNPLQAARTLYGQLHDASAKDADYIFLLLPELTLGGVWEAILNRLEKAASAVFSSPDFQHQSSEGAPVPKNEAVDLRAKEI